MGLVNATNGNISAKYEYGPFGEVFCSVGDMAKVNPFGFSTKYTDNETDLLYYGNGTDEIVERAFEVEPKDGMAILPGVVSRKKQIIPPLMATLQNILDEDE